MDEEFPGMGSQSITCDFVSDLILIPTDGKDVDDDMLSDDVIFYNDFDDKDVELAVDGDGDGDGDGADVELVGGDCSQSHDDRCYPPTSFDPPVPQSMLKSLVIHNRLLLDENRSLVARLEECQKKISREKEKLVNEKKLSNMRKLYYDKVSRKLWDKTVEFDKMIANISQQRRN
ncbi:hypothetical protein L6452_05516 [Arctium lappa]|uniref:Uncharacterized protein n=1 Tax=Arctium lappa TaxID=4217 RepID=A0ACB9EH32_ARCLA|nr:hypothetical protein L6452_05516 [Arctium lappa]